MKNTIFFQFYSKQVAETWFWHSTTPNTSFYQVLSILMLYFPFYGTKTLKMAIFDPKMPKIHARESQ